MSSQRGQAVVDGPNGRRNDLAAIHICKAKLRLDEDEYRDVMATVCAGVRSSADLDFAMRKRFRAHLEACVARQGGVAGSRNPGAKRAPLTPSQRKMWALWMQLADAGLVQQRTMAALTAYAKRQTGVERLEWLNRWQDTAVIESLKAFLERRETGQ